MGATDLEVRLLYTAGTIRFGRGEFDEALELHGRGLEIATGAGDPEGMALAHHRLCETYFFLGPWETSLTHGREADRILKALGQRQMVAHNAYMLAWALGFQGHYHEALDVVEASIAESQEVGNVRDEAFARFERAQLALSDGRLSDSLDDGAWGCDTFRRIKGPRGVLVGLIGRIDTLGEARDLEAIEALAFEGEGISSAMPSTFHEPALRAAQGWLALARGQRAAALDRFTLAWSVSTARLDRLWAGRTEVLAWEWAHDADGLADVAARIGGLPQDPDIWTPWGTYAGARAALLRGDFDAAAASAARARRQADDVHERRVAWRGADVQRLALDALDRPDEARLALESGARIVGAMAEAMPSALRAMFLSRDDVAALLAP